MFGREVLAAALTAFQRMVKAMQLRRRSARQQLLHDLERIVARDMAAPAGELHPVACRCDLCQCLESMMAHAARLELMRNIEQVGRR